MARNLQRIALALGAKRLAKVDSPCKCRTALGQQIHCAELWIKRKALVYLLPCYHLSLPITVGRAPLKE